MSQCLTKATRLTKNLIGKFAAQLIQDGWLDAVDWGFSPMYRSTNDKRFATVVPKCLAEQKEIAIRGDFFCEDVPDQMGVLFECDHLDSLTINDVSIDLNYTQPLPVWDFSCRLVDIRYAVRPGQNIVTGTIRFSARETTIFDDAFLTLDIVTGHTISENIGPRCFADMLKQKSPDIPVDFYEVKVPFVELGDLC